MLTPLSNLEEVRLAILNWQSKADLLTREAEFPNNQHKTEILIQLANIILHQTQHLILINLAKRVAIILLVFD